MMVIDVVSYLAQSVLGTLHLKIHRPSTSIVIRALHSSLLVLGSNSSHTYVCGIFHMMGPLGRMSHV